MKIKKTSKEIMRLIKKNKVMTQRQIEETYGYSRGALNRRLKKMIQNQQITFYRIPKVQTSTNSFFNEYLNTKLYYVFEDDLHEWIRSHLPKRLPKPFKQSISNKLGIDVFGDKRTDQKSVIIDKKIHKKLKKYCSKKNISIRTFVADAINEKMEAK